MKIIEWSNHVDASLIRDVDYASWVGLEMVLSLAWVTINLA